MTNTCSKCGKWLIPNKNWPLYQVRRKHNICRDCHLAATKLWQKKHTKEAAEQKRKSYLKNKAQRDADNKAWKEANSTRYKELQHEYYLKRKAVKVTLCDTQTLSGAPHRVVIVRDANEETKAYDR